MSHFDIKSEGIQSDARIAQLVDGLRRPQAYPDIQASSVELLETHISWIFLVADFAFKVKKPVQTPFLDYSTLQRRKHFCDQEVRLDRRYAPELYLGVVPICIVNGAPVVGGDGQAIEYAVKMRRFPKGALMSEHLQSGALKTEDVFELAQRVAAFHQSASRSGARAEKLRLTSIDSILENAIDNLRELRQFASGRAANTLVDLDDWTGQYFENHRGVFAQRLANGFIRECHGDLHLENIVRWNGQWVPFDCIEFSDAFRWIDVISDAAFVAMDFAAHDRLDLCRSFINTYLESTGDHASLAVLRWYLVYRALVRAKVAAIRGSQSDLSPAQRRDAEHDCEHHIDLASQFSRRERAGLWITHGVSGSGKTTSSEWVVQHYGAIRLRSDIERKRHFGMAPTDRPTEEQKTNLYNEHANHATYARLRRMARCILRTGYPVVIDATFLRLDERRMFASLAKREGASFGILQCHANEHILRQRITDRLAHQRDASDADLLVLDQQLASVQPLATEERQYVVTVPDLATVAKSLQSIPDTKPDP